MLELIGKGHFMNFANSRRVIWKDILCGFILVLACLFFNSTNFVTYQLNVPLSFLYLGVFIAALTNGIPVGILVALLYSISLSGSGLKNPNIVINFFTLISTFLLLKILYKRRLLKHKVASGILLFLSLSLTAIVVSTALDYIFFKGVPSYGYIESYFFQKFVYMLTNNTAFGRHSLFTSIDVLISLLLAFLIHKFICRFILSNVNTSKVRAYMKLLAFSFIYFLVFVITASALTYLQSEYGQRSEGYFVGDKTKIGYAHFVPKNIGFTANTGPITPVQEIISVASTDSKQLLQRADLLNYTSDTSTQTAANERNLISSCVEYGNYLVCSDTNHIKIVEKPAHSITDLELYPSNAFKIIRKISYYEINSFLLLINVEQNTTGKTYILNLKEKMVYDYPELQCEGVFCPITHIENISPEEVILVQSEGRKTTYKLTTSNMLLKKMFDYGYDSKDRQDFNGLINRRYFIMSGLSYNDQSAHSSLYFIDNKNGERTNLINEEKFPKKICEIWVDDISDTIYLGSCSEGIMGYPVVSYSTYDFGSRTLNEKTPAQLPQFENRGFLPTPKLIPYLTYDSSKKYFSIQTSILPFNLHGVKNSVLFDPLTIRRRNNDDKTEPFLLEDSFGNIVSYDGNDIVTAAETILNTKGLILTQLFMLNQTTLVFEVRNSHYLTNLSVNDEVMVRNSSRVGIFNFQNGELFIIDSGTSLELNGVDARSSVILTNQPIYHYYNNTISSNWGSFYRLIDVKERKVINQFILDRERSNYGPIKPPALGPNIYKLLEGYVSRNQLWEAGQSGKDSILVNSRYIITPNGFYCENEECYFTVSINPNLLRGDTNDPYETIPVKFSINNRVWISTIN